MSYFNGDWSYAEKEQIKTIISQFLEGNHGDIEFEFGGILVYSPKDEWVIDANQLQELQRLTSSSYVSFCVDRRWRCPSGSASGVYIRLKP